jgi:hypothetical protein
MSDDDGLLAEFTDLDGDVIRIRRFGKHWIAIRDDEGDVEVIMASGSIGAFIAALEAARAKLHANPEGNRP